VPPALGNWDRPGPPPPPENALQYSLLMAGELSAAICGISRYAVPGAFLARRPTNSLQIHMGNAHRTSFHWNCIGSLGKGAGEGADALGLPAQHPADPGLRIQWAESPYHLRTGGRRGMWRSITACSPARPCGDRSLPAPQRSRSNGTERGAERRMRSKQASVPLVAARPWLLALISYNYRDCGTGCCCCCWQPARSDADARRQRGHGHGALHKLLNAARSTAHLRA
jgi:hypothetical protein